MALVDVEAEAWWDACTVVEVVDCASVFAFTAADFVSAAAELVSAAADFVSAVAVFVADFAAIAVLLAALAEVAVVARRALLIPGVLTLAAEVSRVEAPTPSLS